MAITTTWIDDQRETAALRRARLLTEGRVQRYRLTGEALTGCLTALTSQRQVREKVTITSGLPGDALFVRMALDELEHRDQAIVLFLAHESFPVSWEWTWLPEAYFNTMLETWTEEEWN